MKIKSKRTGIIYEAYDRRLFKDIIPEYLIYNWAADYPRYEWICEDNFIILKGGG
jgi:hypothetical protein